MNVSRRNGLAKTALGLIRVVISAKPYLLARTETTTNPLFHFIKFSHFVLLIVLKMKPISARTELYLMVCCDWLPRHHKVVQAQPRDNIEDISASPVLSLSYNLLFTYPPQS